MIRKFADLVDQTTMEFNKPSKKPRVHEQSTENDPSFGRILDVPARIQWRQDHGYCGETATQCIALTHGAWISQFQVRKAAGGELLIGTETFDKALQYFSFENWDWDFEDEETPQYEQFIVWMKKNLADGIPVIFGIYVTDGFNDPDYDHIVTAVGFESKVDTSTYCSEDVIILHSNYVTEPIRRRAGSFSGTRQSCKYDSDEGGCIPVNVCYGIAVKSLIRPTHAETTPIKVHMDATEEPYISPNGLGEAAKLYAKVECRDLKIGQSYNLVRYDGYEAYASGYGAVLVASWKAQTAVHTIEDPLAIKSDSCVFYQCKLVETIEIEDDCEPSN